MKNLPDNIAMSAISIFMQDRIGLVSVLQRKYNIGSDMYHPFDSEDVSKALYKLDIGSIMGGAISHGSGVTIKLNNQQASLDVSSTLAKGGVSGFFDIFSIGGSGGYSKSTSKFTSSKVEVVATFDHVLSVTTFLPGDWFNTPFLDMAISDNRSSWTPDKFPNWGTAFGPEGNMKRIIEELILVDGVTITTTSNACYNTDAQKEITTSTNAGVWPFFSAHVEGGTKTSASFNEQGQLTMTTNCPRGNPYILGASIRSIEEYLKSKNVKITEMAL